jgi:hypothetical protein
VGGLPVIAGPILLVIALEHGRAFASHAANGTLLGVVALIAFVVAYAFVSLHAHWAAALAAGWGAFLVTAYAMDFVHLGSVAAFACALAACALGLVVLPRRPVGGEPGAHFRGELAFRALCTALPVIAITSAARQLGPHAAGILASFPIITPVVSAFTHARHGAGEAVQLLIGFTAGFFAYAAFCFLVAVWVTRVGTGACFAAAAVVALAIQATVVGRAG